MRLPRPRGPRSTWLCDLLHQQAPETEHQDPPAQESRADDALTLWILHELHYRGFDAVDERWEWSAATLTLRAELEADFEARLRAAYEPLESTGDVAVDVKAVIAADTGASLARHVQQRASREQTDQLLRQRSLYHLKEADPTSWVVPRLSARPKAALLEVQFDEYGNGDPARLHHALFERGLAASGLCAEYGAYVDDALTEVLEQNNLVSMLGLQRRLRGAALGHLAAFEMTSSIPSRQLAQGLRRLDFPEEMAAYYDEHVEADAVHEQLALHDVCAVLVDEEPHLAPDVVFGAWACLHLESAVSSALLTSWDAA